MENAKKIFNKFGLALTNLNPLELFMVTYDNDKCSNEIVSKYTDSLLEVVEITPRTLLMAMVFFPFEQFDKIAEHLNFGINEKIGKKNETFLMFAIKYAPKFIGKLINLGADVNVRNYNDKTPLIMALKYCPEYVDDYILCNASEENINTRTDGNRLALNYAFRYSKKHIISIFTKTTCVLPYTVLYDAVCFAPEFVKLIPNVSDIINTKLRGSYNCCYSILEHSLRYYTDIKYFKELLDFGPRIYYLNILPLSLDVDTKAYELLCGYIKKNPHNVNFVSQ